MPLVSKNLTILQKEYLFSNSQLLNGIRKGGTIQGRKCANTRSGTNISPSYKETSFCSKWVHDRDTKYSFVLYLKSKPKEGRVPTFVKKRLSSYIILLHSFSILHSIEAVAWNILNSGYQNWWILCHLNVEEDLVHLFFLCPFSISCWWSLQIIVPNSIDTFYIL